MGRRKSSGWRAAARSAACDYPRLRRELEARQSRGAASDTLRLLDAPQQKRLDAVEQAITISAQLTSGPSRVKLIELLYFSRRYTIAGAAMQIPVSVQTAKVWNSDFLLLVWSRLRGK
jgi:hypothetical protein